MPLRPATGIFRRSGGYAAALLLLACGPAWAQGDAEWRDFGDWSVHWDKRANRVTLLNALPATRTGRMACAAAAVVGDPAELRIADADVDEARKAMDLPAFACVTFNCRPDNRRLMTIVMNAQPSTIAVSRIEKTDPGLFSLYFRLGDTVHENAIFASAPMRGPARSVNGAFVLDAFSIAFAPEKAAPFRFHLSLWTSAAFVASLESLDRLGVRIPGGSGNSGNPQADAPHQGRILVFGLGETAAALAYMRRACGPAN